MPKVYAVAVMMSFHYASTLTRGNWFQTNQPEQELDDRAGDTVISVYVTIESGKFDQHVTASWCSKTKIIAGPRILVLAHKSLVRYVFQNLLTISAYFLQKCT